MTSDPQPSAPTPDDIQTTGRVVRRRRRPSLSAYLPVRFPPDILEDAKALAIHDGVSVSSWVRDLVTREVVRRRARSQTRVAVAVGVSNNLEQPTTETEASSDNPKVHLDDRYGAACA
jgi:hypothetical protein